MGNIFLLFQIILHVPGTVDFWWVILIHPGNIPPLTPSPLHYPPCPPCPPYPHHPYLPSRQCIPGQAKVPEAPNNDDANAVRSAADRWRWLPSVIRWTILILSFNYWTYKPLYSLVVFERADCYYRYLI